jgi:hypothetical protein
MRSHHWTWRHASLGVLLSAALLPLGPAAGAGEEDKASDEKARALLKKMSEYLAGLKEFAITVDEAFDTVDEEGVKLQSNRRRRVWVRRPDHLRSESTGGTADLLFVYGKGGFLLVDKENKSYVAEKAPDTIDEMLDEQAKKYGRATPLSDFVRAEPFKGLVSGVREARYVGTGQIGDHKSHHLVFRQKFLDWQLWVEDGDKPLPRKFVITYKRQAGQPQYAAHLHHWDLEPKPDPKLFDLTPPEGMKKVEIAPEPPAKKP